MEKHMSHLRGAVSPQSHVTAAFQEVQPSIAARALSLGIEIQTFTLYMGCLIQHLTVAL